MIIKSLKDEDFVNYKLPSMFIITSKCSFKCDLENGTKICQNSHLTTLPDIEIDVHTLIDRYLTNTITKAIVFGGLEPLDSIEDIKEFICAFRKVSDDDIIIYTGYNKEEEVARDFSLWILLHKYSNIIIKYGRFKPNHLPHVDNILGIELSSDNQFAVRYNFYENSKKS